MAKVQAIKFFGDIEATKNRVDGEIWECSQQRADILNAKNLVIILESDKLQEERDAEFEEKAKTRKKQIKPTHLNEE